MAKQSPPRSPAEFPPSSGTAGLEPPRAAMRELGPPGAIEAAERVLGGALEAAKSGVEDGDHHAIFSALAEIAKRDAMVGGAIIFLHLSYTLEAIYRAESRPN